MPHTEPGATAPVRAAATPLSAPSAAGTAPADVFFVASERPTELLASVDAVLRANRTRQRWTAEQDLDLVIQHWRYLLDPNNYPSNRIAVSGWPGRAAERRIAQLRRQPHLAHLLPKSAPSSLEKAWEARKIIFEPARLAEYLAGRRSDATPLQPHGKRAACEDAADAPSPKRSVGEDHAADSQTPDMAPWKKKFLDHMSYAMEYGDDLPVQPGDPRCPRLSIAAADVRAFLATAHPTQLPRLRQAMASCSSEPEIYTIARTLAASKSLSRGQLGSLFEKHYICCDGRAIKDRKRHRVFFAAIQGAANYVSGDDDSDASDDDGCNWPLRYRAQLEEIEEVVEEAKIVRAAAATDVRAVLATSRPCLLSRFDALMAPPYDHPNLDLVVEVLCARRAGVGLELRRLFSDACLHQFLGV